MRTYSPRHCYLCGSEGETLFEGLEDLLFRVPGEWGLQRCKNPDCGLVWLDPRPASDDLGSAYENYYTHEKEPGAESRSGRIFKGFFKLLNSLLKWLILVQFERKRLHLMYLEGTKKGRLLEVGCGNGRRLRRLRDRGWEVLGQEVDPKAAAYAVRKWGLPVRVGPLVDLKLPEGAFDTIIMNHVVEHLEDPIGIFRECHRLLKPTGSLIVVTPNVRSYGSGYFKSAWRGLEPPRHLHLFSPKTLEIVAARSGFPAFETWTTAARADRFARESLMIGKRTGELPEWKIEREAILFQFRSKFVHILNPSSGEECVLKAVK